MTDTIPYHKFLINLMYITNPSLLEDMRFIFAIIQALFQKESTEGVAKGQTTAEVAVNKQEIA